MKNKEGYKQKVYVIEDDFAIIEMTYSDYLHEYWSDLVTSPRGVEHRRQVASVLVDENGYVYDYSLNDLDSFSTNYENAKWGVFTWGVRGSAPIKLCSYVFDTEEEAEEDILDLMNYNYETQSRNVPSCYFTKEEAEDSAKEFIKYGIRGVVDWIAFEALRYDDLFEIYTLLKGKKII